MRNSVNIKGLDQLFTYVIEYVEDIKNDNIYTSTDGQDIYWTWCEKDNKCIHLFEGDVEYFRHGNNWYSSYNLTKNKQYIPNSVNTSKIKVYIPNHSVSTYKKGIKYAINTHTWINGIKIDLGSFIFKPTDTIANDFGILKFGNNEYTEHVEFEIIDPFYLTYSDDWIDFRHKVCGEKLEINSTGSILFVSLYVIDEYDNRYLIDSTYSGGMTSFNISEDIDFLKLNLSTALDPFGINTKFGLKLTLDYNYVYDWLLSYLYETYNINTTHRDIEFELVIKNKDSIIIGPRIGYSMDEYNSRGIQFISYNTIMKDSNMSLFFSDWNNYEDGWNFVMSMSVIDTTYRDEIFTLISNEIPITQEVFSRFINGGSEKIIELKDMNINTYNVVNKIENKIFQIERPNDSKENIMQPVFFRVKETEVLTLHPVVTENICINLDDYKSKVDKFVLQIEGCRFDQIGANNYGILFKVIGNKIPAEAVTGTYYILNENFELVTTGKYNCVR